MNGKKTWVLIIVIIGIIFLAIAFGAGYYLIVGKPITIKENTVVEVVLNQSLHELPPDNPLTQIFGSDKLSLWELGKVFQYAAEDDRVSAIYLEIHLCLLSWAQIEELRDYIKSFRESGKPVHALLAVDMVRDSELYLASAADSITLNPDAGLLVNGLLAQQAFFKRTMDKLRIKPQFIQFKEYKSAENFTREKMTPEIREMLESILRDIEGRFVSTVAQDRNTEEESLRRVMKVGMAPADQALEEKLVDTLGYKDEVVQPLMSSDDASEESYRGLKASHYLDAVKDKYKTRSQHKVALLGGLGAITAGHSDPFMEMMGGTTVASHLRKIRKDKNIKGVIFRVDSPGGSAVGSDMVWKEVRRLEEDNKPVVVSMSGVAGSGGYYISMGARHMVSQPSTITGSIGVIFGKFDMKGFYHWLGITVDQVKLSPNADIFSSFTSLNDEQKRNVESWMETIYENFVQKAAEGRGLDYEELEPKARGRIYTGAQAKEMGLVDELGGLQVAIARMKQALELEEDEEIELVLYPRPKSLWETLTSGDFFGSRQPPSWREWLEHELQHLSRPAPWLLMPEVRIY
ncbi:MAG: signal peptide peptidase SppA [Acidobacteriota bacterium]